MEKGKKVKKSKTEAQKFQISVLKSALFPLVFVLVCCFLFFLEWYLKISFTHFGIQPQTLLGLRGIFCMPFIHGDIEHLTNNSFALLSMGTLLFFFYKEIAFTVFLWIFFVSGLWTWSLAKGGYHIGASAVIYGLFGFLLLSGLIRRDKNLLAISFLSIFAYQGIVWGVLPSKPGVSWQGHMAGLLTGIVLAVYFRKLGPQKKEVVLNDDDTNNEFRYGKFYWDPVKRAEWEKQQTENNITVVYFYKKVGE